MSAIDICVRRWRPKSLIVALIAVSAAVLTAGVEPTEWLATSGVQHRPGSKAVSEKVETDIRVPAFALPALAVDDFGFRRMQLQAARRQAGLKAGHEGQGFLLGSAVNEPVICISTPREVRMCPRHPEVKRVVQEKIRENRTDHSPYTKGNFGREGRFRVRPGVVGLPSFGRGPEVRGMQCRMMMVSSPTRISLITKRTIRWRSVTSSVSAALRRRASRTPAIVSELPRATPCCVRANGKQRLAASPCRLWSSAS